MTILVTGALGNVGSAVVESLIERGADVRAADRSVEAIVDRFGGQVSSVALDFWDAGTFGPALHGVRSVFLIRPPAISRVGPTLNRFIDAAADAEVEHVVFSSVLGADSNRIVPHYRVEQALLASDLAWTILRPGFFAQNVASAYRHDIVTEDRILVPAGDARVAFVDARDLAEAAAICLLDRSHRGRSYPLTGPEAITFDDLAGILSGELGRTITYEPIGGFASVRRLLGQGVVFPQALVQTILHVRLRTGEAEPVFLDLSQLLGREPRTMEQYVADHRGLWKR